MKGSRRSAIAPFYAMDVLRKANARSEAGFDVLHLEIGEPSRRPPARVIEAAKAALDGRSLGYTEALGLPELRARIARHYRSDYGLDLPAERIVITTGSSGAFLLAFLSAFDAGDRIGLATPGYPAYRNTARALDLRPVNLAVEPETGFQPSPALIESCGSKLDGLIVASPSNPTGSMLATAAFDELACYCSDHGIRLISDEVYHGITYGRRADCALAFTEESVVINSFSKYFAMTGWRIGWMVVPEELMDRVERLAQNLFISPPTLPQYAAMTAFECRDELDSEVSRYAHNRAILLEELPEAAIDRFAPADGAFYLYADVSNLASDSMSFCERMLAETGVATTPGVDFDPERGRFFVRFSFAGATGDIEEAARRLRQWTGGQKRRRRAAQRSTPSR